jgi:hypothetical protein
MNKYAKLPRVELKKSQERYPKYLDTKTDKKCTIVQFDFIQMLLNYTEAVDSYFCISNAYASYLSNTETCESPAIVDIKDIDAVLSSKVILRKVDLNFKKMVHIRFSKESCHFYRDEMKQLLLLNENMKDWHEKYGSKFDGWIEFVKMVEGKFVGKS